MESNDSKCQCRLLLCDVYFYECSHAFGRYLERNRCYIGITESVQSGTSDLML